MGTLKNKLGTAGVLAPAGDKYKIALLIGPASAGPLNTPTLTANQPTLRDTFKYGRGPSMFNRLLAVTDTAHYFCRCASTPGTVGAVTKSPSGPAVPFTDPGSAIIPGGAPPAGAMRYKLLPGNSGVSVAQATAGSASIVVTHPTPGTTLITITTVAGTLNGALATTVNGTGSVNTIIFADAVGGSGAVADTVSPVVLDNGGMVLSAKQVGVSFSVVIAGNNTPLTIGETAGAVTINSATDANGFQTSTPNSVKSYLETDTNASTLRALADLGINVVGSGAGLVTAIGSTPLQLGSTGAMTLSGTPAVGAKLVVVVERAGGPGTMSVRWTADGNLENLGPEQFVDGTGDLLLATDNLDLGVTAHFTGLFDVNDKFTATITEPTVLLSDILTALDACLATSLQFGCVTSSEPLPDAAAVLQVNSRLQTGWDTHQLQGVFAARPRDLDTESRIQYQAALALEYASALVDGGLISLVAASCRRDTDQADGFVDDYTGFESTVPFIFVAFPRFMVADAHEDAGWVGGGSLDNVLYVDYDERLTPGLSWRPTTGGAKFWAPTTYAGLSAAEIFVDAAITRFKGTQAQFRMASWVRLACQVGFIASKAALPFVNGNLSFGDTVDATGAPAGALTPASRDRVVREVNDPVRAFLMEVKPRTVLASANDQPEFVDVPRDYDYGSSQELRINYEFTPENVTLTVTNTIRVRAR